jgi:hypothetical protein
LPRDRRRRHHHHHYHQQLKQQQQLIVEKFTIGDCWALLLIIISTTNRAHNSLTNDLGADSLVVGLIT